MEQKKRFENVKNFIETFLIMIIGLTIISIFFFFAINF